MRRESASAPTCPSASASGQRLSEETKGIAWIPGGFAHGFLVTSSVAEVQYKTTDYYAPEHERTPLWNDPALAIPWPLAGEPMMTDKDRRGTPLAKAKTYP